MFHGSVLYYKEYLPCLEVKVWRGKAFSKCHTVSVVPRRLLKYFSEVQLFLLPSIFGMFMSLAMGYFAILSSKQALPITAQPHYMLTGMNTKSTLGRAEDSALQYGGFWRSTWKFMNKEHEENPSELTCLKLHIVKS